MAISLNKPNMPGVKQSLGTSKGTSASTTAAKNLTTGSRPNAFSFRGVGKKGFVHGRNTIKEMNLSRLDCTNLRAELNSGRRVVQQTIAPDTSIYGANVNYKTSGAFNSGANWGTGIAVGIGILNGLAGLLGKNNSAPVSATQQLTTVLESQGAGSGNAAAYVTNSDIALSISSMASCNDSASLISAITTAETQLSSMEAMTSGLETAETQAKENLSTLSGLSSAAEKEKSTAQTGVTQCKGAVTSITNKRDLALNKVKTGNEEYDNAVKDYTIKHDARVDAENQESRATANKGRADKAYTDAQAATASAQQAYDAIPRDPEHAAQRAAAKARLEQAKTAESNAKDAQTKAEEELQDATKKKEEAVAAEKTAQETKSTKYASLGELQTKADELEADLKKEQKNLDDAKGNLLKADKNYDEATQKYNDIQNQMASENSVVNLLKTHKNDVDTLRDAINSEKTRLAKIQKTEKKEGKNKAKIDAGKTPPTKDSKSDVYIDSPIQAKTNDLYGPPQNDLA